jgi:hypothetical protein
LESLVAEHGGFLPDIKVPLFYVSLQTHDDIFTPFLRLFATRNKKTPFNGRAFFASAAT